MKKMWSLGLLLFLCLGILSACGQQAPAPPSNPLYAHKTSYVGDNTEVNAIVDGIDYGPGLTKRGIVILSDQEPYGLIVNLEVAPEADTASFFKPAVATFALVDNLGEITYQATDTMDILASYTRQACDQQLAQMNMPST